ncbi:hypothetical protein Tco_0359345 [Tanacetum coccineum]
MGATNSILTLLLLVIFVSSIAVNDAQCGGGTVNCDGGQTCCQGGFFCCRGGSFCCPRGRTCSNPPGRCFQNTKDASGVVTKVTNMPRATIGDTSLTRSYIPKVSQTPDISPTIAHFYKPIEDQCIHEGRVVDQLYYTSDHIDRCFSNIRLNCLYEINEPIVPHFILDYYSQVTLQRDDSGVILISFMIQNEFITLSLQQFGQILIIPFNGQAVFTNQWDLSSLAYS